MRRRAFLASVGGTATTLAVAGCLGAGRSGSTEYDIGMSSARFRPAEFAVTPGTTVVWRNTSSHAHTVTAYDDGIPEDAEYFASGGFDDEGAARDAWQQRGGGKLTTDDTFEHTFEVPGSYQYVCIPHEPNGMAGTIEVSEDATETPES
jgi:plastocyanin